MTILLTKERYQKLLETQDTFDARVPEYNIQNIKIAYLVEFFEWWNTLEIFKSWKTNKGKPKHVQLDELADLLAFGLSMQNYQDFDDVVYDLTSEDLQAGKFTTHKFLSEVITLAETLQDAEDYRFFVWLPLTLANTYYTVPELLEAYEAKMVVNHERQDDKY